MLLEITVLKNFAIFTEKHVCWSLFIKVARPATLLKKTQTQVFSVNIAKFLRIVFLLNIWWLLLVHYRFSKRYPSPAVNKRDCNLKIAI